MPDEPPPPREIAIRIDRDANRIIATECWYGPSCIGFTLVDGGPCEPDQEKPGTRPTDRLST